MLKSVAISIFYLNREVMGVGEYTLYVIRILEISNIQIILES